MAPEIILGDGYTYCIDFWSIGICIYEFVCGSVPFGDSLDDPLEIYEAIISEEIKFPKFIKDNILKDFIELILKKNTLARYSSLAQIRSHKWFELFDWVIKTKINFIGRIIKFFNREPIHT